MTWLAVVFLVLILFIVGKKMFMMSGMSQITAQSLNESISNKQPVVVIDVREKGEFQSGAIVQSKHIPLNALMRNGIGDIAKDQMVVCVCASGMRSAMAVNTLSKQGFNNVHNLRGGISAWIGSGLPLK